MTDYLPNSTSAPELLAEIRQMIEKSRRALAATVNAGLTLLYWRIGKRINDEILQGERAEYGAQVVVNLSQHLVAEYGNSFSEKNLRRIVQFVEVLPDGQIVVSLTRQLSWTHFIALLPLKSALKLAAAELKQILKAVSWRDESAPPVIARLYKPGKLAAPLPPI